MTRCLKEIIGDSRLGKKLLLLLYFSLAWDRKRNSETHLEFVSLE